MYYLLSTLLLSALFLTGCQMATVTSETVSENKNPADFEVPPVVFSRWYDGERWQYETNFPVPHSCIAVAVATSFTPSQPDQIRIALTSELADSSCIPEKIKNKPLSFSTPGSEFKNIEVKFNNRPLQATFVTVQPPIVVQTPLPDSIVTSPLQLSGEATGTWFFEGDMPVDVLGEYGEIVGQGFVTAQGEWMTSNKVPFIGTVNFDSKNNQNVTIRFRNANPSGEPYLNKAHFVRARVQTREDQLSVQEGFTYSFLGVPFRVSEINQNGVTLVRENGKSLLVTKSKVRFGNRYDVSVLRLNDKSALLQFSLR